MAKHKCNCYICDKVVEVEYDDLVDPGPDEACAGILCDECAEKGEGEIQAPSKEKK